MLLARTTTCVMASHVCMATVCDLTVSAEIKHERHRIGDADTPEKQ